MCVCVCVIYTYIYIHTYIYVCIYICIYIYIVDEIAAFKKTKKDGKVRKLRKKVKDKDKLELEALPDDGKGRNSRPSSFL